MNMVECFQMETFEEWLEAELKTRGWRSAELAREAGIADATLSRILLSTRKAGPKVCVALASALGYPPEYVFRRAGLLPAKNSISESAQMATYLFEQLPEISQTAGLAMLRGLAGYRPGVIPQMMVSEVRASYDHARVHDLPEEERSLFQAIFKLLWRFSSPEQRAWAARWFTQAVDVHTMDDQEREPALEDSEDDR